MRKDDFIERNFQFIFYLIIVGAALLYILRNFEYNTGIYNDDALYVIVANKFWNTAMSHPLQGIKPDFPMPGLPMALAPFARFVKPHWTLLEWVSVFVTLLSVFALGKWVRKWMSSTETLIVVFLFAFNPIVAKFAGILMPEPYFTAAVIFSFYLVGELLRKETTLKALGLGFILGWGSVVRPEGILLMIGVVAGLGIIHRKRKFFLSMAIPLVGWFFFILAWFWSRQTSRTEYGSDLNALMSFWSTHFNVGISFTLQLLHVFLINVLMGVWLPPSNLSYLVSVSFMLIFLTLIIAGFTSLWKQKGIERAELISAGIFCGSYLMAHLFWHVARPRYFIPLLPFALMFLVRGAKKYIDFSPARKLLAVVTLLPLLSAYAYSNSHAIVESLRAPDPMKSPPWRSLKWLRHNTKPTVKLISNIDSVVELYARRQSKGQIKAKNISTFLFLCKDLQLDYLFLREGEAITPGVAATSDPNAVWGRCRRWVRSYPEHFHLVFQDPIEKVEVYEIAHQPGYRKAYRKFVSAAKDYAAGNYERSFETVNQALAINPNLGCAVNLLGALYMLRRDATNCQGAFLRAIELMPDSPVPLLNLATLYYLGGQRERASELIKKALDVSVRNGEQEGFIVNLQNLQALWEKKEGAVLIDSLGVS